jgi:steroid 5-alpha reductase family enzyme
MMGIDMILTGLILTFVTILIHFTVYFFRAVKQNNFGIIDIGWGQGFVLVVWSLMIVRVFLLGANANPIGYLTLILTTIWGLRLSSHISQRNHGKPEDKRYTAMRAKIKPPYVLLKSYVNIFLLQALFMFIISLVLVFNVMSGFVDSENPIALVPIILGVFVWLGGYLFQSVGDRQLAIFIAKPENKGKLMTQGLWAYTRHPNYFGEVLMWWGIAMIGFANSFGIVFPLIGFISPLVVTWLLRYVSGVPLLEKHMKTKPGFAEYEKTTNIFFPWFPKKNKIK